MDNSNANANDSNKDNDKEMFIMDYTKQSKQNIDTMLDDVNFSDEEDEKNKFKLNEETYKREMKKIHCLYEDEDISGTMNTYTGTKHELDKMKEIPIPFDLNPNSKMILCGIVNHLVEDKALIDQCHNKKIVNLDNIIFNKNNIALGYIDDVIGNIDRPIYVMKIYPTLLDNKININQGDEMFLCEEKASLVKKEDIMKKRGCDASNAFDEEVLDNEMEYSDDEEEMQVKTMKRQQKKNEMQPPKKMKYEQQMQQLFMPQQMQIPLKNPQQQQTVFSPFINPEYKFQQQQPSNINNVNYNSLGTHNMIPSMMMMNQMAFGNMMNNAMQQGINPFARPLQNTDTQMNLSQYPPSSSNK